MVEFNDAPGFNPGEAVTIIPYVNCGTRIACRTGKPNCSARMQVCGVYADGEIVEYLSVTAASLVHGGGLTMNELGGFLTHKFMPNRTSYKYRILK